MMVFCLAHFWDIFSSSLELWILNILFQFPPFRNILPSFFGLFWRNCLCSYRLPFLACKVSIFSQKWFVSWVMFLLISSQYQFWFLFRMKLTNWDSQKSGSLTKMKIKGQSLSKDLTVFSGGTTIGMEMSATSGFGGMLRHTSRAGVWSGGTFSGKSFHHRLLFHRHLYM